MNKLPGLLATSRQLKAKMITGGPHIFFYHIFIMAKHI